MKIKHRLRTMESPIRNQEKQKFSGNTSAEPKAILILLVMASLLFAGCRAASSDNAPPGFVYVHEVIPDAILEIRYNTTFNFTGERIHGYERPVALLTKEAATALKAVSDDLKKQGFRIKIYDAYRPRCAVAHFMKWAKDPDNMQMKAYFYPNMEKSRLFAEGYIAEKSGHSRGSTVDLTLFDMASGKEVDMGGKFDWFSRESRPDWCGDPETGQYTGNFPGNTPPCGGQINAVQFRNRMILRRAMMRRGFKPYPEELWHFTLENEPFPETYFDHPVR